MGDHGTAKADEKPNDAGKGKGKGKAPMTWDYVKEHMNEELNISVFEQDDTIGEDILDIPIMELEGVGEADFALMFHENARRAVLAKALSPAHQTCNFEEIEGTEDHADSLIAYCVFFAGVADVQKAVLTDVNKEGFFVSAELGDGSKQDVKVPYEGGPIEGIDGVGKVMVAMSKKARDEVFVTCAPGVVEKITFAPFNELVKNFKEKCAEGDFAVLADMYASDAVLVPQFPGPPPAIAPLLIGRETIRGFFEGRGPTLLKGLTLKPMRLYQKSETEVTEIGRAWGSAGRPYCRQWTRADGAWLLNHDCLPVLPPAVTL